jgi:hypothetical protein
MRNGPFMAAGAFVLLLGCTGATGPSAIAMPTTAGRTSAPTSATATRSPSEAPTPGATVVALSGLPLDPGVAGRPRPGDPSVMLGPQTRRGGLQPDVAYSFSLGHCGLGSPFDLDGSLWDPVAGHDGSGGPLTADHAGELINQTAGTATLLSSDVAEFRTPLGAIITLVRLPAQRAYFLCR